VGYRGYLEGARRRQSPRPFRVSGRVGKIASIGDRRRASSFLGGAWLPPAGGAGRVRRRRGRHLRFNEKLGAKCDKVLAVVVSAGSFAEASARRLFLDEARRRVLSLLEDLHWFGQQHGQESPPWCVERLTAIAHQIQSDDVPSAVLADTIAAVELEIRNALVELDADRPIAYVVVEPLPAPKSLRPVLTVLRGGRE
jgi:hypothetical protein